ncbi:MAG: protein-glutamate O-methyltransferase CheR [Sphingobacteriales bacterium]|nr:MAG: protein-glutamate O-methyltransferase CheR [Sphingobacteriales bacterium]
MISDISKDELQSVLDVIKAQYGYDFSDYASASLKRRVLRFLQSASLKDIAEFRYRLSNDSAFFSWFVQSVTVNVTEMFRDPQFYKTMRETVLPKLASYPVIKIWHAGCSTGEEVYSMAIMLHEQGLLKRSRVYATDINPANLERAMSGIMSTSQMKDYTQNYIQSGGMEDFSSYYTARYDNAILNSELRKSIIFSQHNLVTDAAFNEFHLVCCRNVLIYFNRTLQNRVMQLFHDSLAPLGYLALGIKESLLFSDIRDKFESVSMLNKIYRRHR